MFPDYRDYDDDDDDDDDGEVDGSAENEPWQLSGGLRSKKFG